ncbi:UDP-glucose 4-epimerase GalE [Microbacterium sp. NPDC055903]
MKVLITGGAGYIGSTVASCCSDAGIEPVILDDLSTGLRRFGEQHVFYQGDVADVSLLDRVFLENPDIDTVIHCAAKIVVPESVRSPLDYYENNVSKSIVLARSAAAHGVTKFIVSSTAAMYDPEAGEVIDEASPVRPGSPYASSKMMMERVLEDLAATGAMRVISLRYFNPVGADPKMRTGLQNPEPTHALGRLMHAYRESTPFTVTGTRWPTRDGSGLRDYVHVWDLARAHVAAVLRFHQVMAQAPSGFDVINLGTGIGTTVFELIEAFESVTGATITVDHAEPRPGDTPGSIPRAEKAARLLDWTAQTDLRTGIVDSLKWANKLSAVAGQDS